MQPQSPQRELPAASFAGLLSALTSAKSQFAKESSPTTTTDVWTDNLQDDVETLSYERALQNHAKFKRNDQIPSFARSRATETAFEPPSQPGKDSKAVSMQESSGSLSPSPVQSHAKEKKTASVTLRMSQAEFTQLQQRAVEANLSISAYLRSCTFEAEALRSQVKQALAEMRNPAAPPQNTPATHNWLRFIRRHKSH